MSASIEGRVPFLDHRLVEFAFSLPPNLNLLNNSPKGLFKEITNNILPIGLSNREKEGFNPPDKGWFGEILNNKLKQELLENSSSLILDLINRNKLEKLLLNKNKSQNAATTLYSLFLFNKWLKNQKF
jgi:asparagine synthase (glutamine-hydrolysing)